MKINFRGETTQQIKLLVECLEWMEELRASGDSGFWTWDESDTYTKAKKYLIDFHGIDVDANT